MLVIFYAYWFYPIWLFLRAQLYARPMREKSVFPKISVAIAVRVAVKSSVSSRISS
jgi:hypothetical protein